MESGQQNNNTNNNHKHNMFYGFSEGKSNEKSLVWHQWTVVEREIIKYTLQQQQQATR